MTGLGRLIIYTRLGRGQESPRLSRGETLTLGMCWSWRNRAGAKEFDASVLVLPQPDL